MRIGLVILFYLFLIIGCKSRNTIPRGIIPNDKMQKIIWDMVRADEYFSTIGYVNDTLLEKRTQRLNMYGQIFQIHKTTKEEFKKSLVFYQTHPALLKTMMDSLNIRQKKISLEPKTPKSITDTFQFRKRILPKVPQ
jgi:hypothetical protein